MIVLCIADSHDALSRKPQVSQYGQKTGTLVDPAGQDHHRFVVKDYVKAEFQLPDGSKNGCIMRSYRCHNTLSHGKRHSLLPQIGHEFGGGARAQKSLLARYGVVKQSAVLSDNPVKEMEARKHIAQARKFAAGDQYHFPSRLPRSFQRSQGVAANPPIAGQSPIVIRGYCPKSHRFSVPTIVNADRAATLGELLDRATALTGEEAVCH